MLKLMQASLIAMVVAAAATAHAAQLSTDARASLPRDVQQLVVVDYHAMQNSTVGMDLRDRIIPPVIKRFEEALTNSGLDSNHDVEMLVLALLRTKGPGDQPMTVGIAQGQFPMQDILANFRKQKIRPATVGANKLYPLPNTGMVVCFIDPSTMLFGGFNAVKMALDTRDSGAPSLLTNAPMMEAMKTVDSEAFWSILDENGTQAMMRQVLGEASSVTDFEAVRERLQASCYSMDFQHGLKFDLTLTTGDTFAAATLASVLNAAMALRKIGASDIEKQALNAASIDSNAGKLSIHFATTDSDFSGLMRSSFFQSMVQ